MLRARTRGTTRPSCSSTKVLKLGVTVLELALLPLREEVAQLDIFFPLRRKGVVVLPALVGFRLRGFGCVLLGQRGQLALLTFGHGSNSWQKGSNAKAAPTDAPRATPSLRFGPGQGEPSTGAGTPAGESSGSPPRSHAPRPTVGGPRTRCCGGPPGRTSLGERDPAPRSRRAASCTLWPTVPPAAGTRGRRAHPPPPRLRASRRSRRCRCGPACARRRRPIPPRRR